MIRTLIVDDEPLARERLRTLLQHESDIQIVGECVDGRQAVTTIASEAPDLVFLDIQMPALDGFGVRLENLPLDGVHRFPSGLPGRRPGSPAGPRPDATSP